MRQIMRAFMVSVAVLAIIATFGQLSSGQTQQLAMTRHVRAEVASGEAKLVGRLPASEILNFDVMLPLRDRAGLQSFIREQYDPASPFYHLFLTPQEVTERYGPSQEDWDALVAFAKANGFQVVGGDRDGRDLWLTGSVANIESAFHVTMGVYQDPQVEGRTFYATDREPTTNLPFPLWHVTGLDNNSKPHPLYVKKSDYAKAHGISPDAVAKPNDGPGSGPSSSYLGSDMRAAYYGTGSLTGTGQNIGLFELAGADLADLATYYSNIGQTEPYTPTLVSTGGYATACLDSGSKPCDDIEQTIDMQNAMGVAPGSTMTYMYVCGAVLASGSGGFSDSACISAMVSTTLAPLSKQIGCSWGWSPADTSTLDPYFEQMAAQGQNFFAASGDSAKWSSSNTAWPADDANVVSVGGTDLTTVSAGGAWKSETAWTDSGGGNSPASIPIPSWQLPVDTCSGCSKTLRNGPDVSAEANFDYYYCGDQKACGTGLGGTSFATPLWAGYLALANQQAAANGESIGFINPIIYPQAELGGTTYSTLFHDITSGTCGNSAGTGYDLCTGWGSPNGVGLINLLAPVASGTTPQTISCTSVPSSAAYGSNFTVSCSATSGLAVAYTSSGGCSNSGATYTMTSGTNACSVIANQSGNATYAAAPTVTNTVTASLATDTVTFTTNAPSSAVYNTHFTVAASGTTGDTGAITYTSGGACTNSGATYTMTSGTGTCTVTATQAADSNYASGSASESTTATLATDTVTFTTKAPASAVYGSNFTVAASGLGTGAITYSSAGVCSNSGATYTMTSGTGTCTVTATQAADSNYNSGTASENTTATLASNTVTFTTKAPSSAVYNSSFTVAASGLGTGAITYTSAGVCTNAGATYTMTSGTGTCTETATQAADSNYASANASESTTAAKVSNTVTFTTNAPASATYNSHFTVAASGLGSGSITYSSGGVCTNSGATYTMTSGTGTCTETATQAADNNYLSANASETTSASSASQTITFTTNAPASAAYNSQFTVAATASSGLAVTFTSAGGCTNSGATYTMTSGTNACSVIANQAGNSNYSAATPVTETTNATKASATVSLGNLTLAYTGAALSPTVTTTPSGLSITPTGYPDTNAGSYPVTATVNDPNYAGAASGTFVITKAAATVTLSNMTQTYTGSALSPTVSTTPSGLSTSLAGAPDTNTGSYSVTATVNDPNYTGSASGTFVISKASQTITFTTNAPSSAPYNSQFTVAATASSGLAVTYSASGSCTNAGATYTMTSGTGSCSVIANQAGNSNYTAASPVTQTTSATQASQTITFTTPAPASAEYGSSFVVAATGGGSGNAVVFTSAGGCTNVGATYTITSGSGTCSVIANQGGNSNYAAAAQVTETVSLTLANATVGVASSQNPSGSGQSVTFTATIGSDTGMVKGRNGVRRKPLDVNGSVTWSSNTGCGTTGVTAGYPGTATCTTTTLPVGTDTITATYSGDSNHNGATGTLSGGQVVSASQASSSTAVVSSLDPSTYGQPVNFAATVTAGSGTPTGTVQFSVDGGAFGAPAALVAGTASSASISTLAVGTHTVTAVYSGDANFLGSTGALGGGQVVSSAASGTVVTSNVSPSIYGQPVTLTATINGEFGLVKRRKPMDVGGQVTWSSNTGCGTTTVTSGNPGTATCTTSKLGVGSDTVTASYSGDGNHGPSSGSLSQSVNQAATSISVTNVSPASEVYGQNAAATITAVLSWTGSGCSPHGERCRHRGQRAQQLRNHELLGSERKHDYLHEHLYSDRCGRRRLLHGDGGIRGRWELHQFEQFAIEQLHNHPSWRGRQRSLRAESVSLRAIGDVHRYNRRPVWAG